MKVQETISADNVGNLADVLGTDAISELLLQAIDNSVVDSSELIREEVTALV